MLNPSIGVSAHNWHYSMCSYRNSTAVHMYRTWCRHLHGHNSNSYCSHITILLWYRYWDCTRHDSYCIMELNIVLNRRAPVTYGTVTCITQPCKCGLIHACYMHVGMTLLLACYIHSHAYVGLTLIRTCMSHTHSHACGPDINTYMHVTYVGLTLIHTCIVIHSHTYTHTSGQQAQTAGLMPCVQPVDAPGDSYHSGSQWWRDIALLKRKLAAN